MEGRVIGKIDEGLLFALIFSMEGVEEEERIDFDIKTRDVVLIDNPGPDKQWTPELGKRAVGFDTQLYRSSLTACPSASDPTCFLGDNAGKDDVLPLEKTRSLGLVIQPWSSVAWN